MLNQMGHMGVIQLLGQITPSLAKFDQSARCFDLKWLQNRFRAVLIVNPSALNRFLNFQYGNNWCAPSCYLHEYSSPFTRLHQKSIKHTVSQFWHNLRDGDFAEMTLRARITRVSALIAFRSLVIIIISLILSW